LGAAAGSSSSCFTPKCAASASRLICAAVHVRQ
jgi:hypothetical protein